MIVQINQSAEVKLSMKLIGRGNEVDGFLIKRDADHEHMSIRKRRNAGKHDRSGILIAWIRKVNGFVGKGACPKLGHAGRDLVT